MVKVTLDGGEESMEVEDVESLEEVSSSTCLSFKDIQVVSLCSKSESTSTFSHFPLGNSCGIETLAITFGARDD